ncbi:ribbon-helix-helix protein, CopG family [Aphanizomenon flos-aquae]|uniref:ribbon-helix-helix protein, CopG family n=1 Tax=Aphanizomenon flos-aquae TaxID=1176 RepID=UPI000487DBF9|nr:ribbon-helix-helix protein, CopG family [Aphanizomenon flos-aquae]
MEKSNTINYFDTVPSTATFGAIDKKASNASNIKRMSVSLSDDIARLLEFLAESQGISQNEALRKAIATEAYLLKERQQGTKVLLQRPDKEIREVLFR